jgi:tetraprenyl-beta-curcumene synthase
VDAEGPRSARPARLEARSGGDHSDYAGAQMARALSDRQLAARAGLALGVANVRYWPSVWPLVRAELRRWELRARAIDDHELRGLALAKLHTEAFNAEVAATLATLAPVSQRKHVVAAIVALELLFDYLDGLTENPSGEPLRDAGSLFEAFTDALDPDAESGRDYYRHSSSRDDGGYLDALSSAVRAAVAELPSSAAIQQSAARSAARCAEAQIRIHAEPRLGAAQLQEWAEREAQGTGLGWRELAAGGASSVLTVHALIAAAAAPLATREEAAGIETAYTSICVLITVLDSLVDYDEDMRDGEPGFIRFYEDRDQLAATLSDVAGKAMAMARRLPNGAHHVMTLAGVVAYYTSAPGASSEVARPLSLRLQRELAPLIYPTLAVMRAWRLAKRGRRRLARAGIRPGNAG